MTSGKVGSITRHSCVHRRKGYVFRDDIISVICKFWYGDQYLVRSNNSFVLGLLASGFTYCFLIDNVSNCKNVNIRLDKFRVGIFNGVFKVSFSFNQEFTFRVPTL